MLNNLLSGTNQHKLTLSPGGFSSCDAWMEYAIKHKMAPIHNSNEKPVNSCLQNFTHSGVVGGGVRAFGPSLSKILLASSILKPWKSICYNKRNQQIIFDRYLCCINELLCFFV